MGSAGVAAGQAASGPLLIGMTKQSLAIIATTLDLQPDPVPPNWALAATAMKSKIGVGRSDSIFRGSRTVRPCTAATDKGAIAQRRTIEGLNLATITRLTWHVLEIEGWH